MKKFVFASVVALASLSLVHAPSLRAQDSDQITIKDPAEFNAYQTATTQSDPKAKTAALESFLQSYPQSVVKKAVLDMLVDTYYAQGDTDKTLSAAGRMLQVDPNNLKAILYSVLIKKAQGGKTADAQTLDDAAALARRDLLFPSPPASRTMNGRSSPAPRIPFFIRQLPWITQCPRRTSKLRKRSIKLS